MSCSQRSNKRLTVVLGFFCDVSFRLHDVSAFIRRYEQSSSSLSRQETHHDYHHLWWTPGRQCRSATDTLITPSNWTRYPVLSPFHFRHYPYLYLYLSFCFPSVHCLVHLLGSTVPPDHRVRARWLWSSGLAETRASIGPPSVGLATFLSVVSAWGCCLPSFPSFLVCLL